MTNYTEDDVAGAVFDFVCYLNTHDEAIAVGGGASPSPVLSRVEHFLIERQINHENPNIKDWNGELSRDT